MVHVMQGTHPTTIGDDVTDRPLRSWCTAARSRTAA